MDELRNCLPFQGAILCHLRATDAGATVVASQDCSKSRHTIRCQVNTLLDQATLCCATVLCRRRATYRIHWRIQLAWDLYELCYLVHLLLARLAASLCESLLGSHATYVIVEKKFGRQERCAVMCDAATMHCDVQATRIILVTLHFDILQETHKLGHTPTQELGIGLHKYQLNSVNDQKSSLLSIILGHNGAGNQIAIV